VNGTKPQHVDKFDRQMADLTRKEAQRIRDEKEASSRLSTGSLKGWKARQTMPRLCSSGWKRMFEAISAVQQLRQP
jgi:hypothetical protein